MSDDDSVLREYYSRRSGEYDEAVYDRGDPVCEAECAELEAEMRRELAGGDVLDVACGTGFRTVRLARFARHVVGVDASPEMLAVARRKSAELANVVLVQGDAYHLAGLCGSFTAAVAHFWFSHVPRARVAEFLAGLHGRLGSGAVVFMADNVFIPGRGGTLVVRPGSRDTYKRRELSDGSQFQIVKNYYPPEELGTVLGPGCRDLRVHFGRRYWWVRYRTA